MKEFLYTMSKKKRCNISYFENFEGLAGTHNPEIGSVKICILHFFRTDSFFLISSLAGSD